MAWTQTQVLEKDTHISHVFLLLGQNPAPLVDFIHQLVWTTEYTNTLLPALFWVYL